MKTVMIEKGTESKMMSYLSLSGEELLLCWSKDAILSPLLLRGCCAPVALFDK
jgi:hypothetical protein